MNERGGSQRIPRPATARQGAPPPWAHLASDARRFTLDTVRAVLAKPRPSRPIDVGPNARPAAVLVALFEVDGDTHVILTKRPETMPSHQGEIAFPGGKHDPAIDATLADTALREAHEEVDLDPATVEIVAQLEPIGTVASQFVITPFVGFLTERPMLVPHEREVESVFDVSLAELLADETHRSEIWPTRDLELNIHFYELTGETVWGATARILTNLLVLLTAGR